MGGALVADAAHWNLRGPVRSMRSEIAERDLVRSDWKAGRFFNFVAFDENGRVLQLDQRGAKESVFRQTFEYDATGRLLERRSGSAGGPVTHISFWRYDERGRLIEELTRTSGVETTRERDNYDDRGRRTKIETVDPKFRTGNVGFGVDGSEMSYGAPGAATVTTRYDEHGRSSEVVFHGDGGIVVQRVVFTRDSAGCVLTEEAFRNARALFQNLPDIGPQERETMLALASQAFGSIRTTNEYDVHARVVRRTRVWGMLSEDVTAFTYNEHGDVSGESHASTNREMGVRADGQPELKPDATRVHDTSYSYEYDARGNWTSRVVSSKVTSEVFAPQNIERRTIEYYRKT